MPLNAFQKSLATPDCLNNLKSGLIGEGISYDTPFGTKKLIYADYTASGRALKQVESFITEHVLPFYANSHTVSSFCGAYISKLREDARALIAENTNSSSDCSVIFSGSGATSAINRLVSLSGIKHLKGSKSPVVFIGPYEHHSNILPWRESGAKVVEIAESPEGGPDLVELKRQLVAHRNSPLLIGSFSAASNVSGIVTDTDTVTKLLKQHDALAFWDYAGGGPYMKIDMNPGEGLEKDAVFLSPHKFPGGPGASGLLIVRNTAIRANRPTWPGGGSVSYVSPWDHSYLGSVIEREEAGTPNIIGDIRAALVFIVKAAIGEDYINTRDRELGERALAVWSKNPNIRLLGTDKSNRLPIFSFAVKDDNGNYIHHQLFTRLLSDITGIQARGGCVCAGPYGHLLLNVGQEQSEKIQHAILAGKEIEKPGWVRLNFSYLMDDETADRIIKGVDELSRDVSKFARYYQGDEKTANFTYHNENSEEMALAV